MQESNNGPVESELILLICNLFPNGFRIPIEDLALYGMGLKFFEGVNDMIGARLRVHGLIKIINHRYLITFEVEDDLCGNQYVKKLAGALEVATWNASTYQLVFRNETILEKWPETNRYEDCYGLSLVLTKIIEYPINFVCPKLYLLQLRLRECPQSLPIDFFKGMKELRVLSLDVSSLPQPLNLPRNLRALRIKVIKLKNMFVIGSLRDLKFLLISTQCLSDIPKEIGNLGNLRFLDLSKMNLGYIPPGILSRMLKLKELYLPLNFKRWGCTPKKHNDFDEFGDSSEEHDYDESNGGQIINATPSEIASLFSLKALQICIPNASILPTMSPVFKNIQKFKIFVSHKVKHQPLGNDSINELHLTGDVRDLKKSGISCLMRRTEDLSLTKIKNLKNVMHQLDDNDLPQLEKMIITECGELEYLVDSTEKRISSSSFCMLKILHLSMLSNLKEIWHGTHVGWFQNLRQINIRFCHKLKYVFPSIALGLMRLESIEILDCSEMEGVFYGTELEGNTTDEIHFNCIRNLNLQSLPKLVGLLAPKENTTDGFHVNIDKFLTTNKVSLIKGEDALSHTEIYTAFLSEGLTRRLKILEKLRIAFCDALKVIFSLKEDHATTTVLNSLIELELYGLRNLVHIWFHIPAKIMAFQKLQVLCLSECHNSYLLSSRVAKLLVQLQKIEIRYCEKMEKIVVKNDVDADDKIVFPRLKALELQHMSNLRIFYYGIQVELPLLNTLKLNQCKKMKYFSRCLKTPMLKKMEINGSIHSLIWDVNTTIMWYMEGWDSHINRWMKAEYS